MPPPFIPLLACTWDLRVVLPSRFSTVLSPSACHDTRDIGRDTECSLNATEVTEHPCARDSGRHRRAQSGTVRQDLCAL